MDIETIINELFSDGLSIGQLEEIEETRELLTSNPELINEAYNYYKKERGN